MDFIDHLKAGHDELRRGIYAVRRHLEVYESAEASFAGPSLDGLRRTLAAFLGAFRRHERYEEAVLEEAFDAAGPAALGFEAAVRQDHELLEGVLDLLAALVSVGCGCGPMPCHCPSTELPCLRFVVEQSFYQLERHMMYEETEVFPFLRRGLTAELLRTVGVRAQHSGSLEIHAV